MGIGKYLTNAGVIGSVFGVLGTARQTKDMPRDWRRYIVWGIWGAGLLLTVISVAKQPEDEEFEEAQKRAEKELKAASKSARGRP